MTKRGAVPTRLHVAAGLAVLALATTSCGDDGGGGGTAASWCDFVDESDVVDEILDGLAGAPNEVEAGLRQVETFVKRLPDEAPPEIADDAKALADGTQQLVDAFAAADFSLLDADLSFMQDSNLEARLNQASANIDTYTERECGRPFGETSSSGDSVDDSAPSTDSGSFDPGAGTLRDQLISQFESLGLTNEESTCIAENLDFEDPAIQSGDMTAMFDVFDKCGISLDRLATLGGG